MILSSIITSAALTISAAIGFAGTIAAGVCSAIGYLGALAIYGGVKAIKLLYSNKTTPLKIYEIGRKYKPRFDAHINEYSYIDRLIDEAANDLIS